jgi:protein gp37
MKKPQVIFVCSMADLFGEWVPQEWIEQVINSCIAAPQHTYIFLTKNPERMRLFFYDYPVQKNFWLGTSCGEHLGSWERIFSIKMLGVCHWNTMLSVEPLQVMCPSWGESENTGIDWMIIGMQTNPLTPCQPDVLTDIIDSARQFDIPVFMKDSVKECFSNITMVREYPAGVLHV